jgi:hypothetical protein
MKITRFFMYNPGTWELRHEIPHDGPGVSGRHCKQKRRDLVVTVKRITGNAVRRRRARSHSGTGYSEVCRAVSRTGHKCKAGNQE